MARFKILSDFDGVWTNQRTEAQVLLRTLVERLATLRKIGVAAAERELAGLSERMRQEPAEHGWAPDGRISAFIDEDPLLETSALCRLFQHAGDYSADPGALLCRDAVLAGGFGSLHEFSESVFQAGTAAYRSAHRPCMIPDAKQSLERLRDCGAEIVVISNSATDKLVAWFADVGIDAREDGGGDVRVRGSAAKWMLGPSDERLEHGGRSVYVDRPRYRAAIEEESPNLIIGDVFSLDLALPHAMRKAGHAAAPQWLALRRHPHTPAWVTAPAAPQSPIDFIVDSIDDLATHLPNLRS